MKLKSITKIKTQGEARQIAIDWQGKQSKQSISYLELAVLADYFRTLARKFNLVGEFKENGII